MKFILFLGLINASEYNHLTLSSSLALQPWMVLGLLHRISPVTSILGIYASQFLQPSFLASPNFNTELILRLDVMPFSAVDGHHKASRKGWNVMKESKDILGAECDNRLLAVVTNGCYPDKTLSTSTCSTRRHEFKLDPIPPMLTPTGK